MCEAVDCTSVKEIQEFYRPSLYFDNFDSYSSEVIKIVNEFLYSGKSPRNILRDISHITITSYFSWKASGLNKFVFIVITIVFQFILISAIVLSFPKYKEIFDFFNKGLWLINVSGSLVIILSEFMNFGILTKLKCHLSRACITIGYTLIFIPYFYKLSTLIPVENKFSKWMKRNKYFFPFLYVLFEALFNSFLIFSPFETKNIVDSVNNNIRTCELRSNTGLVLTLCQVILIMILYAGSWFFFVFGLEYKYDKKLFTNTLYNIKY